MKTRGYSIWLEPDGELRERLVRIIKKLSARFKTPLFIPHVTLLGGIEQSGSEVLGHTQEITKRIKPYFINLTGVVSCEEHWTKSMFIIVADTQELLGANNVARKLFGLEQQELYHPHLSLMYSGDIPIDERLIIAKELPKNDLKGEFKVSKVHFYKTDGKVKDWKKIADFKLSGS